MLKWAVFSVLWVAGLFIGDALSSGAMGGTGSRLVFFGGIWMLACLFAKDCVALFQEARGRK